MTNPLRDNEVAAQERVFILEKELTEKNALKERLPMLRKKLKHLLELLIIAIAIKYL